MRQFFIIIISILSLASVKAQETLLFTNPDSLLEYAVRNSVAMQTGDAQILLTKYQTLYAKINRFNPHASANFAATDNTQLSVNFLPAEIFGGLPGTFKEVQFGQQYIQSLNITPQIDIINPAAWARVKSATSNEQLSVVNNLLIQKTLSESIVAAYFNIVSFQQQIIITTKTLLNSDSILQIFQNKYEQGIIRIQDVNNAKVNKLLVKDRLQQLQNALDQQYNVLKSLCDVDMATTMSIEHNNNLAPTLDYSIITPNTLSSRQSLLQLQYAKSEYKASRAGYYPTLSLIGNWAWQKNSNQQFFSSDARLIPSTFFGLRLTYFFPDAIRLSQTASARTNWHIAELNLKHNALQQEAETIKLQLDLKKVMEIILIAEEIMQLKNDTYEKNLNLFVQDIYPADNLFISFNDALTASINYQVALANFQYQKIIININNSIQ